MNADQESTEGFTYGAIIGLSGLIVAGWLSVALLALHRFRWLEWRFGEFLKVVDGAGRIPFQ